MARIHPWASLQSIGSTIGPRHSGPTTSCCEHCHEQAAQRIVENGSRLWLLFVPLFTFSRRYLLTCSNCGVVTELSRELALRAVDPAGHGDQPR